ncbi:cyclic nucleotide-binding domain-containing protein [Thiovibrio sp. JS02]
MNAAEVRLFGMYTAAELNDIFSFLSPAEIEALAAYLEPRSCRAGEVLMREGDVGDSMGFLVSGKLAVKKETTFPGKFVLMAVLERGSMVGEVSVVECGRRNATVVATEMSQLLMLSCQGVEKLARENPSLGLALLRRIIHVMGYRLRKASDRLSRLL